jgi:hypothetical protein
MKPEGPHTIYFCARDEHGEPIVGQRCCRCFVIRVLLGNVNAEVLDLAERKARARAIGALTRRPRRGSGDAKLARPE